MDPAIQDNPQTKYSDYQLLNALNSILALIYNVIGSYSSSLLNQTDTIKIKKGQGDLPDDFLSVVQVRDSEGNILTPATKSDELDGSNYKIRGSTIYADNASVTLEYKPFFEEITYEAIEDDLALPNYFSELIRKYTIILLIGGVPANDASLVTEITQDVYAITAGREFSVLLDSSRNHSAWR